MTKQDRFPPPPSGPRRHYIAEWMQSRGMRARDITEAIGADKGTISRWVNDGNIPRPKHLAALVGLFELDDEADLFRHPTDVRAARLLRGRDEAEVEKIIKMIEIAFPPASG